MPTNKNQHYIPQHYLRQFRIGDTKQISVARIDPFEFFPTAGIKGQCQEDYFYKTDGELDRIYTTCERNLAPVISRVADKRGFDSQELTALQLFAVIMHVRTKRAIEEAKTFPRKMFFEVTQAAIARGELPPPPADWSEKTIDFGGVAGELFKNVAGGWLEARSLACKLLESPSEEFFITSDHPVILMNQMFEHTLPHRLFVGFSRSGFQMLLPISPSLCLIFFDQRVYKVGDRKCRLVPISQEDTELINSLQIQSAETCVFSHDPTRRDVISNLVKKYGRLRKAVGSTLREVSNGDEDRRVLHHFQFSPELPRPWSFCRLRRRPRIGEDNRRDPEWTAYVKRAVEDMDANQGRSLFESMDAVDAWLLSQAQD